MSLDKHEIKKLLSSVAKTLDEESTCDECLAGMAEFAETQLVGAEISDALELIRAHIASCPECAEEYAALLEILGAASSDASNSSD